MGLFLAYNIKLAICFLFFYLLYKLVFSQTTFYRINRKVVLIAYFVLPFLPFIEIETRSPLTIYPAIDTVEQFFEVPVEIPSEDIIMADPSPIWDSNSWAEWFVILYGVGVLSFVLRYFYFLLRVSLLIARGERQKLDDRTVLVVTKRAVSPFSWMRFIVMSESDYKENNRELLLHEQAHVHSRHSIDLLIAELFAIMQWFNPAAWLMKKELKEIHEYEADDTVINSGVHIKQYQLLLIKKAVGTERFNSMTNSFNHSKLKKRITMMMKKKTSAWGKLQYLAIIPAVAVSVTMFARPALADKLETISETKVSNLTLITEETGVNIIEDSIPSPSIKNKKEDKEISQKFIRINASEIISKAEALKKLKDSGLYSEDALKGFEEDMKKIKEDSLSLGSFIRIFDSKPSASQEVIDEFKTLRNQLKEKKSPSLEEQYELYTLYGKLNRAQQNEYAGTTEAFFPKTQPSKEEFESWKDASKYGVWVDRKKINNDELTNYSYSDISIFHVSRLMANAKKGKNYDYQVDLTTNENYDNYVKKIVSLILKDK
ncbi:M56 family metallopeptidase [Bacteroidales bacterium OttesenSCG-928-A17]|nr:M56 family metallopeptidase [Bacteroidales bacterium OttesenSCG-928-A17]